jgi:protein required for attachment to host cells
MKAKVTWVLVADGTHAKVFENAGPGAGLTAVRDMMFEEEPLRAQDINSDREGRSFSSVGPGRSGYEPQTDPVDARETRFIKAMAERLEEKYRAGAFHRLVIAAAPAALGDIRPQLSKRLQEAIVAELPKDLTRIPTDKLEQHFDCVFAV